VSSRPHAIVKALFARRSLIFFLGPQPNRSNIPLAERLPSTARPMVTRLQWREAASCSKRHGSIHRLLLAECMKDWFVT
jgi:hypothetical protein